MYAKLSSTITRSSIWREPPATRVVWIALLALANRDGFVKGVEAWLAAEANVSRDECREALRTFMEPDPESQDQDYGGRRVEKVEGGWLVLNYPKYREMRTHEQVLAAERQSRKRKRDKGLGESADDSSEQVTDRHAASRGVTAIASATASASERSGSSARASDASENADATADPEPQADPPPPPPAVARPPALELAAAANRGLDEALGRDRNPLTSGTAANLVEAVQQHGIPLAWAAQAVYEAAKQCPKAPRSLHYFTPGVVERWEREQARAAADGFTPGRSLDAVPIGDESFARPALWALLVQGGLTAPMQTREVLEERCRAVEAAGGVRSADALLAFVLLAKPWELAEITFGKERDARLAEAARQHAQRVSGFVTQGAA
ncbi:MAG: hypothetical protein KF709_02715 [Gemmatimonadaceae bacterium]|nr:hypothetical protein [Gemmatimonadaceae bacterium]